MFILEVLNYLLTLTNCPIPKNCQLVFNLLIFDNLTVPYYFTFSNRALELVDILLAKQFWRRMKVFISTFVAFMYQIVSIIEIFKD